MALLFAIAPGGCAHAPVNLASPAKPPSLAACRAQLSSHQYAEADRCLAAQPASDDLKDASDLTYLRVTALLYLEDFPHARQQFATLLDKLRAAGRREGQAWVHNALTWLAWAEGDLARALLENELVKRTIVEPSVPADTQRELLLHYWWDRAYLLLDVEQHQSAGGASRAAEDARAEYQRLARLPAEHDGLAVLAAYFAARRGQGAVAREAAQTVDASQDGDLQDLYVLALAFDAGGDRQAAAQLRTRIATGAEYPMKPLILRQLKRDAAPAPR